MEHDLTLGGHGVRLVPLTLDHAPEMLALIDDELWAGMTTPTPTRADDVEAVIRTAVEAPGHVAFAVLDAMTAEVRGSTSLYDVVLPQRRAEIGHTYYGRTWWGGPTNPACKLALLTHAFDVWGLHRVALRADARNARSIAAMLRLGAVAEGRLRSHRLASDGTRADTVYFSILAPEWPAVRAGLHARLGVPTAG